MSFELELIWKGGGTLPIYDIESIPVTQGSIDDYCRHLANRGIAFGTLVSYERAVQALYEFLPSPKNISEEQISCWASILAMKGLAYSTINGHVSAANGLLKYLQQTKIQRIEEQEKTQKRYFYRENYLRLLKQAKVSGRHRAYLLIKTIATTGVKVPELKGITIEALQEGFALVTSHNVHHRVHIPEPIRVELLNYAAEQGVETGTLFITKDGDPLVHSLVWKEIKRVCREANLEDEMGTPSTLRLLYRETYRDIGRGKSTEDAKTEYEKLLLEEEASIAWNI